MPPIAVLHLSDIHISHKGEPVLTRVRDIQAAVRAQTSEECGLLLIISGDIAYGGTKEQYEIAKQFLKQLSNALEAIPSLKLIGEDNIPARLIDVSIRLDHFNSIPGDIAALEQKLKENITAYTVLRLLVAEFLYLFPCDYKTEQKMIKLFSFQPAKLLLGEKRVKRRTD